MAYVDSFNHKRLPKWFLLVPLTVVIIISCIILWPKQQENTQEEYVTQLQAAYQEQGITLSSEDVQVRNGTVEVTNQDKANEYVDKINTRINTIYNKYVPEKSKSSNNTAADSLNDNDSEQNIDSPDNPNTPNEPSDDQPDTPSDGEEDDDESDTDINSLLELARKKLEGLNTLWFYFDNSKYIDMNTGETYDDKYQDEMSDAIAKDGIQTQEIVKSLIERYGFTEKAALDYIEDHRDEINAEWPPVEFPEYDDSMVDIDLGQISKALGLLSFINKFDQSFISYYKNIFSEYVFKVIPSLDDTTDISPSGYYDSIPFQSCLEKQLYLDIPDFDAGSCIVSENTSKSYNNDFYTSVLEIKSDNHTLYYTLIEDNFYLLDIE